jgi:hypothetical protein
MKKYVREFEIGYKINWAYGIKISKIRADLDAIEKLGATHVYIRSSEDIYFQATCNRMETDEEYKKRIEVENFWIKKTMKKELQELARLKAKYETK